MDIIETFLCVVIAVLLTAVLMIVGCLIAPAMMAAMPSEAYIVIFMMISGLATMIFD